MKLMHRICTTIIIFFGSVHIGLFAQKHHAQVAEKAHALHVQAHSKAHTKVSPCVQEGAAGDFAQNIISDKVPCPGNSMGVESEPHIDPKVLLSKLAYPASIKSKKKEAWVSMMVLVNDQGKYDRHTLECIKAFDPKKKKWDMELSVEEIEALEESAVVALQNVTFIPAQKQGKSLACWTLIPIHYEH